MGASGTRYQFQVHAIPQAYTARCGVYIACRQINADQFTALYVGECEDFDARVGTQREAHHKWQRIIAAGGTHFGTLFVGGGRAERLRIEADLRQGLHPPLNDQ
jgi:hypothetical protein